MAVRIYNILTVKQNKIIGGLIMFNISKMRQPFRLHFRISQLAGWSMPTADRCVIRAVKQILKNHDQKNEVITKLNDVYNNRHLIEKNIVTEALLKYPELEEIFTQEIINQLYSKMFRI